MAVLLRKTITMNHVVKRNTQKKNNLYNTNFYVNFSFPNTQKALPKIHFTTFAFKKHKRKNCVICHSIKRQPSALILFNDDKLINTRTNFNTVT